MTSLARQFLSIGIIVSAAIVVAPVARATHSWNGYHWAGNGSSFSLKIGDNVSSAWDSTLRTTSADWSVSGELDTTVLPGNAGTLKKCRPTVGRVEVCNTTYGKNGWLGVAQIWISGAHITQGTVKLNDTYFNTTQYNTSAWRNLVSCQEVGHTFGLDHQDENFSNANLGTCMDYTSNPFTNQHPNSHDYEELGIIYNHNDGYTTVDLSAAAALADVDMDEPAKWGKLVKKSKDGHYEAYARDFGNGHQVHTFVIWSDDEKGKQKN